MKSTLITPIFLALALPLFSQTWLTNGQTWEYYVTGGWVPSAYGKMVMQVDGDTIVQGMACKRMLENQPDGFVAERYAYHDQGRVFVFDEFQGAFIKIYDFNLQPGDTVFFSGSRKYVIDSIGTAFIAQADRKYQIVRLSGSTLDQGTYRIVEGLGLLSKMNSPHPENECTYFFLQESFCDEAVDGRSYRFRCFNEDDITYDPFGLCTLSAGESRPFEAPNLVLFPNPAQGFFTVSSGENLHEPGLLIVFDATGRVVWQQAKMLPATIHTEQWPAGNYQVVFIGEKVTMQSRIVVQ